MPATPQEIAAKAEREFQHSAPRAIAGYEAKLPELPAAIIAAKAGAKAAYTKALDSPNFDASVREGLAVGVADKAYAERLGQIVESGFTDSQKQHIADETVVRRHIAGLIDSVIALFNQVSGDPVFIPGLSTRFKKQVVNTILMKRISDLSEASTAPECIVQIRKEIPNFTEITAKA